MIEIQRAAMTGAPYNPRTITDAARKKLERGIRKNGLLAPIVWNKRSGFVVSGHQRLSVLDKIHGGKDYTLKVAVVDLDERAEKEANILLNNPEAQGEWDMEKLSDLLKIEDGVRAIDLDGAGFDSADIYQIFGDELVETTEDLEEMAERVRKSAEAMAAKKITNTSRDDSDFFLVVVFRDGEKASEFLEALGLPDNKYQDGRRLMELLTGEDQ